MLNLGVSKAFPRGPKYHNTEYEVYLDQESSFWFWVDILYLGTQLDP